MGVFMDKFRLTGTRKKYVQIGLVTLAVYLGMKYVSPVVSPFIFAFLLALLLTRGIKGTNLFRTVFFMPNLIGGIVLGYIWNLIINGVLEHFGVDITFAAKYGFWGLVVLMNWQMIGYMMVIYIAGLQNIPSDLTEAAMIDGASGLQTLKYVTLPMVMPSVTICTFLTLSNSFKLFDQNLALTGGQPFVIQPGGTTIKTTEMLALNIYNTFYSSNTTSQGVAQAKAVVFFVLVAGLGLLQLSFTRKREVQQ